MRSTTALLGLLASCSASELIFKTADGTGAVAIAKLVGANLEIASPSGGCTMLDGRCVASAISKLQSDLELVKAVASKALALAEQLQTEAAVITEAQQNAAKQADAAAIVAMGGLTPPTDAPSGPVGARFVLVASIIDPTKAMWKGCDDSTKDERGAKGSDYWMGLRKWQELLKAQGGRPAHLFTLIKEAGSSPYLLQYNNWQLSDNLQQYRHDGGNCYQGSCPSGPQMNHNDNSRSWTGDWAGGGEGGHNCCASYFANKGAGAGGFGWYGHCGYGQFGFEEGGFLHPVDRNGQYQNPAIKVTGKEFWMRLD